MRRVTYTIAIALAIGCADQPPLTQPIDSASLLSVTHPQYELTKIDASLGGMITAGTAINNRGQVAGFATLVDSTRHAVLWQDSLIDLGTLGGANSSVQWPGLNNTGMVVGISQTGDIDPNDESWSCAAFIGTSDRTCLGFVWEGGVMTPLETLGGHNGFATMVNNRGQVVGWAETTVEDPTCRGSQVLQFRAVIWEPKSGTKQELRPLAGDSTSAATAINDRGQVVGISGSCYVAVGDSSARASVMWENGVPREIPNLGGGTWNTPMDINNGGDVVGFSNIGDDANGNPRLFAFLWTGGSSAVNLQALPGDGMSQAYGINARGQVVGRSCGGPVGCRAFLYENGVMHDLHDLLDTGGDRVVLARHISDGGEITGDLAEAGTGRTLMFVATPKGRSK
jgi:probable HAF family extracellular repeat protein